MVSQLWGFVLYQGFPDITRGWEQIRDFFWNKMVSQLWGFVLYQGFPDITRGWYI